MLEWRNKKGDRPEKERKRPNTIEKDVRDIGGVMLFKEKR